jgi:nicotinate-nucleotide adenylyltransferase
MGPIGIFGGTFDPIHMGHLRTAFELLTALSLAEVRFVPCHVPHDQKSVVAPADLRVQMVRAAVDSDFVVDERELRRPGPSYSIDTLESLRDEYPDRILALIMGMDAFLGFRSWHRWEEILTMAHIVVARRPGSAPATGPEITELLAAHAAQELADLHRQHAGRILVQPVTQLEISSSAIRDMVGGGVDPRFLVPDAVREIMTDSQCYRANTRTGGAD